MKARAILAISLIIIILMGIAPAYIPAVHAVDNESAKKIEFYRMILRRILKLPNLPSDIRDKVNNLLTYTPATEEDLNKFADEVKNILTQVGKYVETKMDLSD